MALAAADCPFWVHVGCALSSECEVGDDVSGVAGLLCLHCSHDSRVSQSASQASRRFLVLSSYHCRARWCRRCCGCCCCC